MDRRTFVTTAGATMAGIGLAGCSESDSDAETTDEDEGGDGMDVGDDGTPSEGTGTPEGGDTEVSGVVGTIESGLETESYDFSDVGGTDAVVGVVVNRGRKTYSWIDVEAVLYDQEGNQISTANDSSEDEINNLEPEEAWKFIAEFDDDAPEATEYELNITAEGLEGPATATGQGTGTAD